MSGTPEHDDDALRAAVQRALRAPVDVDPQRREAAVRAAMEAADARMPAALPPPSAAPVRVLRPAPAGVRRPTGSGGA